MQPQILTVQSQVMEGYVGNRAAVPTIEILGGRALSVPTVLFTSHAGKRGVRGQPVEPEVIRSLLGYIWQVNPAILAVGYLGTEKNGLMLVEEMEALDEAGEGIPLLLDPIIGDYPKGIYVSEEVAEVIKEKLVPRAAFLTPNRFEAEFLTGLSITGLAEGIKAAQLLMERGPRGVLITSCCRTEDGGWVSNLLVTARQRMEIISSYYPTPAYGAGDMLNAALAALLALDYDLSQAAPLAVALVTRGVAAGLEGEMDTVDPVKALWGAGPRPFLLSEKEARAWWENQGVQIRLLD